MVKFLIINEVVTQMYVCIQKKEEKKAAGENCSVV